MAGTLILVRHGQSEWNLKNLFTGWKNPDLTEQGQGEARKAGQMIGGNEMLPSFPGGKGAGGRESRLGRGLGHEEVSAVSGAL